MRSNKWLSRQDKDHYVQKAKKIGFVSRSAFKLIEIENKFNLIVKSVNILELGSSPGGWSQVVSKEISKGRILAVDIKPMEKIDNVDFINGDFYEKEIHKKIMSYFNNNLDVVLSDMAADTSGNKSLDSFRTGELCMKAMHLAKEILSYEGIFLSKVFMGSIFIEINKMAKKYFKNVIKYKPLSSKKQSKEIYIYCKGVLKI